MILKNFKRLILRLFLIFEIIIFTVIYYYGPHGLKVINDLNHDNRKLEKNIDLLKFEINNLEDEINKWEKEPFYKERIARELLQMAREDEEIYIIN